MVDFYTTVCSGKVIVADQTCFNWLVIGNSTINKYHSHKMLLLLSMKKCHNLFHSLIEQNIHFTSCIKVLCQIFKNIWPPILQHSKHKTNIYSLFQMYNSISHTKKAWHRICYTDELYCTVCALPDIWTELKHSTTLPLPAGRPYHLFTLQSDQKRLNMVHISGMLN